MTRAIVPFRLMVISDRRRMGADPVATAAAVFGQTTSPCAFQWREKDLSPAETRRAVARLQLALPANCRLVLNAGAEAAPEIAAEFGLDLHLPEASALEPIRRAGGALTGRSTHSLASAREAERQGANYILFGPVFETESKQPFGPAQGLTRLAEVAAAVAIPVFAIGGVTAERVASCRKAGAAGVAVVGAVWAAVDGAAAIGRLLRIDSLID